MHALEKKVPPPVVALLVAGLMWAVAAWPPAVPLPAGVRLPLAAALAFVGVGLDLLGIVAFRRHRTTVHPLRPERTSALVTGGVYRITRNPMYVGLALLLTAWAVYLSALWPFLGPVMFVAYIDRFQIVPEERILEAKFADEFRAYAARVRRWL
jgi:protein-S-isoprenylcysteine O-methyltransferase Ste14